MIEGNFFDLFHKSSSEEKEIESPSELDDIKKINNHPFLENTNGENFSLYEQNHPHQQDKRSLIIPKNSKPKIFKIIKIIKKKHKSKSSFLSRENNPIIPRERYLNVEIKKKRIQFQKKPNKIIYSYCNLEPPLDFIELFKLIKEHQTNYFFIPKPEGEREIKSFHFIRDSNTKKIKIVTFKEKRELKRLQMGYIKTMI